MRSRILIIEDEPGLVFTLSHRFEREGYAVKSAESGEEGLRRATLEPFDLVLLDIVLGSASGYDVCRSLRKSGSHVPILMLTARGELRDKVMGLDLGADDYLTKPFEMAELLARVRSLLRRGGEPPGKSSGAGCQESTLVLGDLILDLRRCELRRKGRVVELSAREFQLLRYLAERPGVALSRHEILREVWGYRAIPRTRTVDVHIAQLRKKIEPNPKAPRYVLTVQGYGYRFSQG